MVAAHQERTMTVYSVREILAEKVPLGSEVTVQGWVRTRRDSKAGMSFIGIGDGSCLAPLQVVAPGELANYTRELLHLSSGCAVEATGKLVASQGKGQKVELLANAVGVLGWVVDPEKYPIQPKAHSF